jgi:hypothetical protein
MNTIYAPLSVPLSLMYTVSTHFFSFFSNPLPHQVGKQVSCSHADRQIIISQAMRHSLHSPYSTLFLF